MKKLILTTTALLLVLAGLFSCGKYKNCSCGEGNGGDKPALEGTQWKLAGIMDIEKCKLKELEPKDCETCYTLMFNTDSTAELTSVMNIINVIFTPEIRIIGMTKVYDHENGDVQLFYDTIKTITSCTVTEKEIKFCCNDGRNYLLYKKQ